MVPEEGVEIVVKIVDEREEIMEIIIGSRQFKAVMISFETQHKYSSQVVVDEKFFF